MKKKYSDEKESRIKTKLQTIINLYEMAYLITESPEILALKKDLNFQPEGEDLKKCCKLIASQIYKLEEMVKNEPNLNVCKDISIRLREIFVQIANLYRDEFRTVRNNSIPELKF